MKISIRKAFSFCTTGWSGGETTELFINPQNSQFKDRDFIFRLSMATVEVEKTQFTSLPGCTRKLMVLRGEMILSHVNQHSKKLKPFDQDRFLGDWGTNAEGSVQILI